MPIPAAVRPKPTMAQVKTRPLRLCSRPPLATASAMVPATMATNPAAKCTPRASHTIPDDVANVTRSMSAAPGPWEVWDTHTSGPMQWFRSEFRWSTGVFRPARSVAPSAESELEALARPAAGRAVPDARGVESHLRDRATNGHGKFGV